MTKTNVDMQLSLFEGGEVPVDALSRPSELSKEEEVVANEESPEVLPGQLNLFDNLG